MGYDWYDQLVHIPYGTVSINGAKLATRTGNVLLLKDLFKMAIEKVGNIINEKNPNLENKAQVAEAVGVGAVVFYYLSNSRIKDSDFNLEDALSFEGNTGPYAQYTYARCCSIIEKAGGVPPADSAAGYIPGEAESDLVKTLSLSQRRYPTRFVTASLWSLPVTFSISAPDLTVSITIVRYFPHRSLRQRLSGSVLLMRQK